MVEKAGIKTPTAPSVGRGLNLAKYTKQTLVRAIALFAIARLHKKGVWMPAACAKTLGPEWSILTWRCGGVTRALFTNRCAARRWEPKVTPPRGAPWRCYLAGVANSFPLTSFWQWRRNGNGRERGSGVVGSRLSHPSLIGICLH